MRRRSTQLLLAFIVVLTTFSILVSWPSDPNHYLPSFIPWPKPTCVGPICIGHGVDLFGLNRREMRLGLDLRGGTRLVLEADVSGQQNVNLNDALNSAKQVIERRINAFGVAEAIIERVGSNRIAVELPGISSQEAVDTIGKTAQLTFMELDVTTDNQVIYTKPDGTTATMALGDALQNQAVLQTAKYKPVTVVDSNGVERELSGTYLDRSSIYISRDVAGFPVLQFGMTGEGSKLMGQATARLSNPPQPMGFALDGQMIKGRDGNILVPFVQSQINDNGQISGLTLGDAQQLSKLLQTGAFPVPLKVVQQEDVDAALGEGAVVQSVQAGLIAILVVMIFMILYYRLPGALAALALFVYVSLTLAVFKLWPVTITSAGIAAFVLSVGMAVDANILIFERMKEELRLGRSLTGAIDAGFSRAWTSIRDSNVSTLITCTILFWFGDQFGASLVKGFALTLALGVVVSMFSAIIVTRTFLHALVGTPVMRHLWLFGSDVEEARHLATGSLTPASGQAPRSPEL